MGLFDLIKKKPALRSEAVDVEYEHSIAADGVFYHKCLNCKTILHAFRYYRSNSCSTYCENCGDQSYACYAAPYKTIELYFCGIQREGYNITIAIEDYPSFAKAALCTYEWNGSGGILTRVLLPADYIPKHTVTEFINDYILSKNEVTEKHTLMDNEALLDRIKSILIDSNLFLSEKP